MFFGLFLKVYPQRSSYPVAYILYWDYIGYRHVRQLYLAVIPNMTAMTSPRRSSGTLQAQHQQGTPSTGGSFLELGPHQGWQMMSTRGQNLPGLLRRYSFSDDAQYDPMDDVEQNHRAEGTGNGDASADDALSSDERPRRRGSILIGDTTPSFRWYGISRLYHFYAYVV